MSERLQEILIGAATVLGIVALLALFGLLIVEAGTGTWRDDPAPAVVVEREHRSSSVTTGSGLVHTQKGSNFVTTTEYTPERWTVIVRVGDAVESTSANPSQWARMEPGRRVTLQRRHSPLFGLENATRIKGSADERE